MSDGTASSWRLAVAATGLGLLVALSLGELLLRAVRPAALSVLEYPCVYRPDTDTGYGYVPGARGLHAGHFEFANEVEINSLGFFDDEPMPSGRPRILAVGDSFTAALAMPRSAVWTSVLERGLRERGLPDADVVNLGLDGSGTGAHVALLERWVPELTPDGIVLAFYANDVEDVLGPQMQRECHRGYVLAYPSASYRDALRERVDRHLASRARRWLHRHSFLARLAVASLLPPMNPYRIEFLQPRLAAIEPKEAPAVGVARWQDAVASLERLAVACACKLWVVPVPPRSDPRGSADVWSRRGSRSLPVLDVEPALTRERAEAGLRHEDLYFVRDAHWNARGHRLFGRILARELAPRLGARPETAVGMPGSRGAPPATRPREPWQRWSDRGQRRPAAMPRPSGRRGSLGSRS